MAGVQLIATEVFGGLDIRADDEGNVKGAAAYKVTVIRNADGSIKDRVVGQPEIINLEDLPKLLQTINADALNKLTQLQYGMEVAANEIMELRAYVRNLGGTLPD